LLVSNVVSVIPHGLVVGVQKLNMKIMLKRKKFWGCSVNVENFGQIT